MFAANTYRIRLANDEDMNALRGLADRNADQRLDGRVLIGEIDGVGAAALSLSDGRVIADSSPCIDHLVANLRLRAASIRAYEATPSLSGRLVAALPVRYRASAAAASATDAERAEAPSVLVHG